MINRIRFDNENGVIQEICISKNNEATIAVLYKVGENTTISFVQDSLKEDDSEIDGRSDNDRITKIQGMLTQSWFVDYPMIAYNSYEPENSEIAICNFA